MTNCNECKYHEGDCMLSPESEVECPVAIEKASSWIKSELILLRNAPKINNCNMTKEWGDEINALEIANKAISQMEQRENQKPLTLCELKQMDGKPVWIKNIYDCSCSNWKIFNFDHHFGDFPEERKADYGKTWLAYRYPPKEVQA